MGAKTDERFAREYRLCNSADYKAGFCRSLTKHSGIFIFRARANGRDSARLGFAVSSKAVKRAVVRNRIKRIIRESFRRKRRNLPTRDYVIVYRGPARPDPRRCREALERFWCAEISGAANG